VLTCSLCNNCFGLKIQAHLPICLDCSHTFCFACLTGVRLGMGIFSTISCPTCGLETTAGVSGVSGLNRNDTIIALINIMDAHEMKCRRANSTPDRSFASSPTPPPPPASTPASSTPIMSHASNFTPNSAASYTPTRVDHQSDVVENVVITIPQYRRLIADELDRRISNRAGCQVHLSIPHISLFAEPPPAVAIITFRGNQIQINDGKALFRKFLRDIRPHSFTVNHTTSSANLTPFSDRTHLQGSSGRPGGGTHVRQTQSFTGRAVSSNSPVSLDVDDSRTELFRVHLQCDYESIGHVLGSRGSRIEELSELTGCKLSTHPVENSTEDEAEGRHEQQKFKLEILGTHEKISVAIPFVKMVLGRGETAMHKVREFYGSRAQHPSPHQSPQPSQQQLHQLHQLHQQHLHQHQLRGEGRRTGGDLPPPPGLERDYNTTPDIDKANGKSDGGRGVSVFSPGEGDVGGRGRGKDRRETFRAATSPTQTLLSKDMSIKERNSDVEELSDFSSVQADEQISAHSTFDDDDDDAVSNKSPLPYTISPPTSPPASAAFPNYFIKARVNKNSEVITLIRYDVEALFHRDGSPSPLAVDIMRKSHSEITWLQHPGNASSESVKIAGEAVNREKAKFLLSSFKREVGHVVVDESVLGASSGEIISRYVDCPVHFIPVLIGTGGYTIEDLQIRTSTRILINDHRDEDKPPQICIIGTTSSVEDALACIERLLMNHRFKYRQHPFSPSQRTRSLPTNTSLSFTSSPPVHIAGGIRKAVSDSDRDTGHIQSGASDQQSLRQQNQSPISAPLHPQHLPHHQHQNLNRQSPQQQSHQQIQQSQQQQQQQQPPQNGLGDLGNVNDDTVATQLLCPGDKVSQLIGKKGSILRELKKISSCEISIERVPEGSAPPTPSSQDGSPPVISPPQVVHISGSRANVEACIQLVNEVIELGPVIALKMQTTKMIIPHDKVPLVIGQRGITAKEMMRRSGCKIHVNETVDADDNCFIELTGTSEQLAVAQELISHVLEHGTKALGKRFQK